MKYTYEKDELLALLKLVVKELERKHLAALSRFESFQPIRDDIPRVIEAFDNYTKRFDNYCDSVHEYHQLVEQYKRSKSRWWDFLQSSNKADVKSLIAFPSYPKSVDLALVTNYHKNFMITSRVAYNKRKHTIKSHYHRNTTYRLVVDLFIVNEPIMPHEFNKYTTMIALIEKSSPKEIIMGDDDINEIKAILN